MTTNAYEQIGEDHEAAKRGEMPDILTNVYGDKPPKAAVFDGGVSDRAGAAEAADARREVKPGVYDSKRA